MFAAMMFMEWGQVCTFIKYMYYVYLVGNRAQQSAKMKWVRDQGDLQNGRKVNDNIVC